MSPRLELVRGDITGLQVDAVVNAANSRLLGGGGVDGAIHRAGGPEVLAECRRLRETTLPGGLPQGQAVATTAGRMPARWVVHTVGPVWAKTKDKSPLLVSCYRECLRVADELGARSIAFPTISAGLYRWPVDEATRIAVDTVLDTPTDVQRVVLVAYQDAAWQGYRDAMATRGL